MESCKEILKTEFPVSCDFKQELDPTSTSCVLESNKITTKSFEDKNCNLTIVASLSNVTIEETLLSTSSVEKTSSAADHLGHNGCANGIEVDSDEDHPLNSNFISNSPIIEKLRKSGNCNRCKTCIKASSETQSISHSGLGNGIEKHIASDVSNNVTNKDESLEHKSRENYCNECESEVNYVSYNSELQMPDIMRLIQKDLSEPYSIYTYRYFIHNWPRMCFLAMVENKCVGAIVCKLDNHRKVVLRGYIAMLAVDENYRERKIGSNLVLKAIRAMIAENADEVVLETEITNRPALRLYENLGFVRDKRLFRYYLNGVDALRLKLWLR